MAKQQTETLEVKNFAGLDDVKITLSDINLFIGPQASGKSIIAKLLYYFKSWFWNTIIPSPHSTGRPVMKYMLLRKFAEFFPPATWPQAESFAVRYGLDNEFMEVTAGTGERRSPRLNCSPFFARLLEDMERPPTNDSKMSNQKKSQLGSLAKALESMHSEHPYPMVVRQVYIPAGRSFFAYLQKNVFTLLARDLDIDPFLRDFGATYEKFRNPVHRKGVDGLARRILCGRHVNIDGEDIIIQPDGRLVDLAHSSSGQQEALPVTVMLSAIPAMGQCEFYVEEPEAHLFPSAQKHVVDLIGTVFDLPENQVRFLLTTHSPYILTAFNNLLQAGILGEGFAKAEDEKRLKALERVVPKNRWLKPSQVAAYFVADGKAKSIMDKDTGLIDASTIDSVSDEIAVEFDKLLEL